MTVTHKFAYEPRDQFLPFHQRSNRWALMVCHRRAGKTVACVNDLVLRGIHTQKKNARYAYVAPFRQQGKEIAWTYLKEFTEGIRVSYPRESELRVKLPRDVWITIYGADNPDALRGLYFDGIILDEFGQMKPSLMGEVIMPCLADRNGWMAIIGTSKGRNQFYDYRNKAELDPTWYYQMLKASESGILTPQQLKDLRDVMDDEEYEQEMECSFDAAVKGTFYATVINTLQETGKLVYDEPLYDPQQKVHVAADVGLRDSTAWWFWQPRADGIAVIDYHEASGKFMDYYIGMLHGKGYQYHEIWLPFDAKAKTLATRRSTVEQLRVPSTVRPDLYGGGDVLPVRMVPKLSIQHGIDATRLMLPKCQFYMPNCEQGVDRLRAYRRQYHEHVQAFSNTPLHDINSNGADGFRYLSLVADKSVGAIVDEPSRIVVPNGQLGLPANDAAQGYNLNQLFEDNEHGIRRRGIIRL